MEKIKNLLFELIDLPGITGFEDPVREILIEKWKALGYDTRTTNLGALIGSKRGERSDERVAKKVMIAAHMDAIGLMVRSIRGDHLVCDVVGGIDARVMPGTPVTVYASKVDGSPKVIKGYIAMPHPKSLSDTPNHDLVPANKLLIEIGLTNEELTKQVNIGDVVSFDTKPFELNGNIVCGHSIDNRASVTIMTNFMAEVGSLHPDWDLYCVATTGEEINFNGAITTAYEIDPDIAIVLDVTFGKAPGSSDWQTFELGKGITIGRGPNLHTKLTGLIEKVAERFEIPYKAEPHTSHSGTDAYAVQVAREGVPTILVETPVRYMHSPMEVISIHDMQRSSRLLTAFVNSLDENTLRSIEWEELIDEA